MKQLYIFAIFMLIANFCFSDDSITKKQSVTTIEGGMYLGDSKADTFMKKMDSLKTKMDSLDRALKANCVGEAKSSYEKLSLLTNKIDIYNNMGSIVNTGFVNIDLVNSMSNINLSPGVYLFSVSFFDQHYSFRFLQK